MTTSEKKCAICSHLILDNSLQCPKCGSGVFESKKSRPLNHDTINTDQLPSPVPKKNRVEDIVNRNCDKIIEIVKDCGHADYISYESSNALANEILSLKNSRDRSLATKLIALYKNNLKRYIETVNYDQYFIKLQKECIMLLIEIEAYLFFKSSINSA